MSTAQVEQVSISSFDPIYFDWFAYGSILAPDYEKPTTLQPDMQQTRPAGNSGFFYLEEPLQPDYDWVKAYLPS